MRTKAQKWGNSLAVRLPRPVALQAGIRPNDTLDVEVRHGRVLLTRSEHQDYRLGDLLRRVTKENLHEETDWGQRMGREVW
jgi:antitoxin MazE